MALDLKGLQVLTTIVNAAPASLAAKVATTLNTVYGSITRGFLVKQWKLILNFANLDPGFGFTVFIGPNGASVTEIEEALEEELINPNDPSSLGISARKMRLVWDTVIGIGPLHTATGAANFRGNVDTGWQTIGGGKGIPFVPANGPILWIYNHMSSAFQSDVEMDGLLFFRGVWLDDS